ncbi:hypothetical protein VCR4J5_200231 [Vibrio crassostreae]|uniref:Uncharacterized protein n=1 Tax=Vibrio crassostreae TaxID=246167 RepID=A0ABP1WUL2_9VIBR|nr:hypothetical protein VCR4J5_200231 [Vibrio crassostreae]
MLLPKSLTRAGLELSQQGHYGLGGVGE